MLSAVSALVLAMGLSLTPAWADQRHGYSGGHERHGHAYGEHGSYTAHYLHHLLKHQKEIGLTEDQVAKLKAMSLDFDKARIKGRADIQVAERELKALVHDEKTDLATIEAKLKQSEMLEVEVRLAAIKTKREALALLTPEQREKDKVAHGKMMSHGKKATKQAEKSEHQS
jgi:Spy/CpxP family protein refolding chaperone